MGGAHERGGAHASGAELLCRSPEVVARSLELLIRAGTPPSRVDFVRLTVEDVREPALCTPCLALRECRTDSPAHAESVAVRNLSATGIAPAAVEAAFRGLTLGFDGPRSLRGAAVLCWKTGRRLDDGYGVRATRFDCLESASDQLRQALAAAGLEHFRTREALLLATRVAWAGAKAELCWSDDPGYDTGYVASPSFGYLRLPGFRPPASVGGRTFFLDPDQLPLETFRHRLARPALWITPPFRIQRDAPPF